jgi:hypothetical protein
MGMEGEQESMGNKTRPQSSSMIRRVGKQNRKGGAPSRKPWRANRRWCQQCVRYCVVRTLIFTLTIHNSTRNILTITTTAPSTTIATATAFGATYLQDSSNHRRSSVRMSVPDGRLRMPYNSVRRDRRRCLVPVAPTVVLGPAKRELATAYDRDQHGALLIK